MDDREEEEVSVKRSRLSEQFMARGNRGGGRFDSAYGEHFARRGRDEITERMSWDDGRGRRSTGVSAGYGHREGIPSYVKVQGKQIGMQSSSLRSDADEESQRSAALLSERQETTTK